MGLLFIIGEHNKEMIAFNAFHKSWWADECADMCARIATFRTCHCCVVFIWRFFATVATTADTITATASAARCRCRCCIVASICIAIYGCCRCALRAFAIATRAIRWRYILCGFIANYAHVQATLLCLLQIHHITCAVAAVVNAQTWCIEMTCRERKGKISN